MSAEDRTCKVYRLNNETESGTMTVYQVFDGVRLTYHEINLQKLNVREEQLKKDAGVLQEEPTGEYVEITHCREGRREWVFESGEALYMTRDQLSVQSSEGSLQESSFPLGRFSGISLELDMERAPKGLASAMEGIIVDFDHILRVLQDNGGFFLLTENQDLSLLFGELYSVPVNLRSGYLKIKVLEILYMFCGMDLGEAVEPKKYYGPTQVKKIKDIRKYLDLHLEEHPTLYQLSERFDIPLTSMKSCFNGVYGMPVYTYLRVSRMQKAARLLRETDETVVTIAGKIGYDNASKFASAFKAVIGQNPVEYRKNS